MYFYLTHLELSMVAILLIGLFGCQVEPGPVPSAMVVCGAIYIVLHEFGRALYREWKKRHVCGLGVRIVVEDMPEPKVTEHRCYIYDLKEDEAWKKQNIS